MIKQNDKRLDENIRKTGCNLRSLQAAAEHFCAKNLGPEAINAIAFNSVKRGWMRKDCYCLEPGNITAMSFDALGRNVRCMQIGYYDLVDMAWKDWAHKKIKDVQDCNHFAVAHWKTAVSPGTGHFCLCDTKLNEIFDPWDEAIGGSLGKQEIDRAYLYKIV